MSERLHQRLRTLVEVVEESGGRLKLGTLRAWVHSDRGGFRSRVVVRPGRLVLVDLDELEAWLLEQRSVPRSPLTAARAEAAVRPRLRNRAGSSSGRRPRGGGRG